MANCLKRSLQTLCAGLKVTGGRMTEHGYLGAFITKVKRGSIADTVAHLRAGKEITWI